MNNRPKHKLRKSLLLAAIPVIAIAILCISLSGIGIGYIKPAPIHIFEEDIATQNFADIELDMKAVDKAISDFDGYGMMTLLRIYLGGSTDEMIERYDGMLTFREELDEALCILGVLSDMDLSDSKARENYETLFEKSLEIDSDISLYVDSLPLRFDKNKICKALGFENLETMETSIFDEENGALTNSELTKLEGEYLAQMTEAENQPDEKQRKEMAEILVKQIAERNKLAKDYGYDNYAQMVYDEASVSIEDVEALEEAIKEVGKGYPLIYDYRYSAVSFEFEFPFYDISEIKSAMKKQLSQFDGKMLSAFEKMDERGMIIFTNSSDASMSGYTYGEMRLLGSPIIYNYYAQDFNGMNGCFHEFGHAYAGVVSQGKKPTYVSTEDCVQEIQSTGLEALLTGGYSSIFKSNEVDFAKCVVAAYIYDQIVISAATEKFERGLYTMKKPTAKKINAWYKKCWEEFDLGASEPYDFVHTHHYFDLPCYQQNYLLSYFASSQLLLMADKDFAGAKAAYLKAASYGVDSNKGYNEVVSDMGLTNIEDVKNVKKFLKDYGGFLTEKIANNLNIS